MAASLDQDDRLACLDAALKDCIHQISSLQEERGLELEAELKEANNRLVRSLLCNQKLVEQLERDKLHLEAQLDALIDRIDSVEKENAFLKCECCALERELLLRPESAEKVTRLEDECRQLRLLMHAKEFPDNHSRKINILVDRLCDVEEDNKALREIIAARENELCSSNMKRAQADYSLMSHSLEDSGKQIVPVLEANADEKSVLERCHWPWNVLDMILEEHQLSKRSISALLDEIKSSLAPQKKQSELNLNESICRMVELIEEISPASVDANLDYSVHVLRWRNIELVPILGRFVLCCSLVLNGSYGLEDFVMQLTALLEWAVGNCITLDDASRVRGKIKKHFSVDRPKSESELDVTFVDSQNVMTKMIKTQCDLQEENKWLKAANEEFETKLRSVMEHNDCLRTRLEESEEIIGRLQEELEDLKESIGIVEDQFDNQKLINEDLDTQLTVTKAKQNEMARKISSLEVELEDKNQSYEELETTCLELQLQLEIVSRKGTPDQAEEQPGKDKQTVSETSQTTTECTKLAEFQEHVKEKSSQHHSLLDILMLTNDDDTKTESRVITAVSSQTPRGGFGFVKKLFVSRRNYSSQINTRTLKRPKRSDSSCSYYEGV